VCPHARDRADWLHEPSPRGTELACLRVSRAHTCAPSRLTPHKPTDPTCPDPCVSAIFYLHSVIWCQCQLFFAFAQPFGYSELNHFWYSELSHFSYSKLSHFSYRAQSFYDFVSHSTTMTSAILLENSVIPRCYSTQPIFCYSAQPFLQHCSVILYFATVSSVIFVILSAIFHCYSELGHCCYSVQSFYNFINHFATVSAIFHNCLVIFEITTVLVIC
jgi:hypothetical protein